MTPEMERIGRIIVEKGLGGCWHEAKLPANTGSYHECSKCGYEWNWLLRNANPDFSSWDNFGRLLAVASIIDVSICLDWRVQRHTYDVSFYQECRRMKSHLDIDIDQIPAIVAAEIARISEEK